MQRDLRKTKQELVEELTVLRQRVAELETLEIKHRQTEEALVHERNLLRTLIDNVPDHIYFKDIDSRFVLVNIAVARHLGVGSTDEAVGKNDFDFSPPELAARYFADEKKLFQSGQAIINQEEPSFDHYSNSQRLVLTTKIPLYDNYGKIIGLVGVNRDITERLQTEEALQQSKKRVQDILESITDAFFAIDQNWKFTYINQQAEQLLHRSRQDLLGKSLWNEISGWDASIFSAGFHRAMAEQVTVVIEEFAESFQGWFKVYIYPYSGGLSVYFRDVSEHKQAEAMLAQRAAQLALINDIGSKIAAVLELDSLLQRVATLVQQMFNYHHVALFLLEKDRARLKAIAGSYQTYFPSNHSQMLNQGIIGWVATCGEKVLANDVTMDPRYISLIADQTKTKAELCLPIKIAGQMVGVLDIQSPYLNGFSENDIVAMETLTDQIAVALENARLYQAVQQELVERKQTEEALRQSQQQVLNLLNHLEELVDERTAELKRTNEQLVQTQESLQRYAERLKALQEIDRAILSAQSPEAIAQAAIYQLQRLAPCRQASVIGFDFDTDKAVVLAAYTHSTEEQSTTNTLLDKSGLLDGHTYINVPLVAKGQLIGSLNLGAETSTVFTSEHVDIAREVADPLAVAIQQARLHEQVQHYAAELEQRVAERTAKLEEINAELKSFTFSVSHDLRAPLRAVQGFATALLEDCGDQLGSLGVDYTRRIVEAAERMDVLVQELLIYSRLSRADLRLQPVDLATIINDVLTQLDVTIREHQAEVMVQEPLPQVIGHYPTMVQVIVNLLTNAIKFVAAGVLPCTHIWAETIPPTDEETGEWVRVWVEDNGIGIDPDHQEQIFQIFERLHGIEAYPGTGIGLAVVRKGVARMGGRVGVVSEAGQGSRFWFELPRAEV